jgi:chromate transporter
LIKKVKIKSRLFLKEVFKLSFTGFGGPEMHLALFLKNLCEDKRWISHEDLMEIHSICQVIPGPSSTQTITAIGYKIGGPLVAFLSLFIWLLPSTILISLIVVFSNFLETSWFKYIGPVAVGFVAYSAFKLAKVLKEDMLSVFLAVISCLCGVLLASPWIFPIIIIASGAMSANFGDHKYTPNTNPILNIKWGPAVFFAAFFIGSALVGALTRQRFPEISEPARLFENTYRMGSLVFGGGNVLYTMIITEFIQFSQKQYLTIEEFNTGLGLVQGIPGPTFSIATYVNGIAMKSLGYGIQGQLVGCGLGTLAIFLPGTLLIFFVFPIWSQLKTYPIIYRSLDGIMASSIGLSFSAIVLMLYPYLEKGTEMPLMNFFFIIASFVILYFTKTSPILILIAAVLVGYLL